MTRDVQKQYKELTKALPKILKDEIKTIYEKRFWELGANKIKLHQSIKYWTLNRTFFKVALLQSRWGSELTDNHSYASNNYFEDVDLMPYDISEIRDC